MPDKDNSKQICDAVAYAISTNTAINIQAGNSKSFYGNAVIGDVFDVSQHRGIVDYEPSELFITARCGTLLQEIESTLDEQGQMLAFEPPHFGPNATLGGTIACGLSGPRRPYSNAARDCVLGAHIVNGHGEYLRFGGQVMKNVAGYDVARLMCGALGTLGIVMQISLKVIPKSPAEITLTFEHDEKDAIHNMNEWTQTNLPITGTYYETGILYVRISGVESTLQNVKDTLGGTELDNSDGFWVNVKEQRREFFSDPRPLWRFSVPNDVSNLGITGDCVTEWNGGLRWVKSDCEPEQIFSAAQEKQGNATLFQSSNYPTDCFQPLSTELKKLHTNMKHAFDPKHLINPGRMYSWC